MQARFVDEYLVDLNATQAAVRAGYSAKTAAAQASRLLTNVKVAEAVQERRAKRSEVCDITAQRVLDGFARIAFSDVIVVHRGPNADGEQPPQEERAVRLADQLRALEALAKHTGVLKEPVAQAGTVNWQVDPERLAKMSEAEIADAVRIGKLLTGQA